MSMYLALDALARIPGYASKLLPDGKPLSWHLTQWEDFFYRWLKARATGGVFVELASTGYWARTWPNMLNLVDLPASARIRARAKMFVDVAMLEAEQSTIAGVRGGQKSRAKRDDITCNMYLTITPVLYGTDLSVHPANNTVLAAMNGLMNGVVQAAAGEYDMSNVSVLVHVLGAAPLTNGTYLLRNRIIGQISKSGAAATSDWTAPLLLPPPPPAGEPASYIMNNPPPGGPGYIMNGPPASASNQVHTIWRTPSYLLGGVVYSPNDVISANSMQRWVGLIFSNPGHTALGMHHITGEKWTLLDEEIGIFQKCGPCHYQGTTVIDVLNATLHEPLPPNCTAAGAAKCWANKCMHCNCGAGNPPCPPPNSPAVSGNGKVWTAGGWTFVEVVDITNRTAWAAVRSAWGGDVLAPVGKSPTGMSLTPKDTWAPVIILTGRETDYHNADGFATAVAAVGLTVTEQPRSGPTAKDVALRWRGKRFVFHAQQKGRFRLPEVDGVAVDNSPPFQYAGPHLQARLNSSVVTATYPGYTLEYRFIDGADEVSRL